MNQAFQLLDEKQVMAITICREAGGEPDEGKLAVGTVILERVDHRDWDGHTVKEVCLKPLQFSCFNSFDKGYGKTLHMAEQWDECFSTDFSLMNCYSLVVGMLSLVIPRHPILAAAHCCQYLNPKWAPEAKAKWLAAGMKVILKVGGHEFFV